MAEELINVLWSLAVAVAVEAAVVDGFEEGMKVEANYRGKGKTTRPRVSRDNRDGTCDIDYDDGEKETAWRSR